MSLTELFNSIRTRDPLPSVTLASTAVKRFSTSDQRMFARVGLSNTAFSVFSCLLFSPLYQVSFLVSNEV